MVSLSVAYVGYDSELFVNIDERHRIFIRVGGSDFLFFYFIKTHINFIVSDKWLLHLGAVQGFRDCI